MSFELPMEERELMRVQEEQKSRVRVVEERLNQAGRLFRAPSLSNILATLLNLSVSHFHFFGASSVGSNASD